MDFMPPMPMTPDRLWKDGKVIWEKTKDEELADTKVCPNCEGKGYTLDGDEYNDQGMLIDKRFCEYCRGHGYLINKQGTQ